MAEWLPENQISTLLDALLQRLGDNDSDVRKAAIKSIAALPTLWATLPENQIQTLRDALIKCLVDDAWGVRRDALK